MEREGDVGGEQGRKYKEKRFLKELENGGMVKEERLKGRL